MLAPVKEAKYHELRPTLGLQEGMAGGQTFSEDENLMWHPQAAGLATLRIIERDRLQVKDECNQGGHAFGCPDGCD